VVFDGNEDAFHIGILALKVPLGKPYGQGCG
jgi:hypothetical protein